MEPNLKTEPHHRQLSLCKTRPAYRQGRKLTALRAYTVNNESQHLFVYGVPQVDLRSELKTLCRKYGEVSGLHATVGYETEPFAECFHVRYERVQSARIAKRFLDNRSFYGGILHVCYAPEYEDVAETRAKLMQRCKDVLKRVGYRQANEVMRLGLKRKRDEDLYKGRAGEESVVVERNKRGCLLPVSVIRCNSKSEDKKRIFLRNTNKTNLH